MPLSIRLKLLRKQRAWSLEALADRAGLTKSYLSKVERGLSVPSIAVAIKLARALEVGVEELISGDGVRADIVLTRAGQRTSLGREGDGDGGAAAQGIAAGAAAKRMLPFILFPPRELTGSAYKEHEGEELLFVHRGSIEVVFPNETLELAEGDSLYFNALIPHKTRTIGEVQAEVLVVVSHDDD